MLKTSESAKFLHMLMIGKLHTGTHFDSAQALVDDATAVVDLIGKKHPELRDNPFPLVCNAVHNPMHVDSGHPELDDLKLLTACRNTLSMLPIDEVSPYTIHVYRHLLGNHARNIDYVPYVQVFIDLYARAEGLEKKEKDLVQEICCECAEELRFDKILTESMEKRLDKAYNSDVAMGLVRHMGFEPSNLESLIRLKGQITPRVAREIEPR